MDCASLGAFPTAMMTSHLTALRNGSARARRRFPRLLQIVDYYPDTIPTFRSKVFALQLLLVGGKRIAEDQTEKVWKSTSKVNC